MKDSGALEALRALAPEFKEVGDGEAGLWIGFTAPLAGKRRFGKLWPQAVALLAAHRMKLAGVGAADGGDALADICSIGVGGLMRVTSYSEGETSIGLNANVAQYTGRDAELALTVYGIQYLSLRNKCVVTIVSSGQG